MRVAFLVSGNGGTMKFLHQAIGLLALDMKIVGVISDRECGATEFSISRGIPTTVVKPWSDSDDKILKALDSCNPDVVVTNIHKIVSHNVLATSRARFVNLHYSLLPAYGGVIGFKTLEMAKKDNAKIIGATCHYVSDVLDGGEIISQGAMPVNWDDDFSEIGDNIFRIACRVFLNSLLAISGVPVATCENEMAFIYSPRLRFNDSLLDESFWKTIKKL